MQSGISQKPYSSEENKIDYKKLNILNKRTHLYMCTLWTFNFLVYVMFYKKKEFNAQISLWKHRLNPVKKINTEFLHVCYIIMCSMTFW